MGKKIEINIGDKFEQLEVIDIPKTQYLKSGKNNGYIVDCKCTCGNISHYKCSDLKRGISNRCISCACKQRVDHKISLGDRFGSLQVIDNVPIFKDFGKYKNSKITRKMYLCKCDCGDEKYYIAGKLKNKRNTCCATCAYKKRPQSTERYSDIERLFNLSIRNRCKLTKGRIENKLSLEKFKELIKQDCFYCGEPPQKLDYLSHTKIVKHDIIYANGIDRIDSSGHYEDSNCVACCKQCNTMKMDMSQQDFKNKIIKLYNKWIKQEDTTQVN